MQQKRKVADWLDGYMQFVDMTEPPRIYHKWVCVSLIAAALGGKCWFDWDKQIFPNHYIILVGPSAECRKGTSMGPAKIFLRKIGSQIAAQSMTREAFIKKLGLTNTSYICQATGNVYMHSSITVFSEELSVLINKNTLILLSDLTDLYDCPRPDWHYETKHGKEEPILNPYVNILGATTPGMIKASFPADIAVSGGFTSRCIFVYAAKRDKLVAFPIQDAAVQLLGADLLHDLEEIARLAGKFIVSEDFLEPYGTWYNKHGTSFVMEDPNFKAYYNRKQTHLFKLCMVLSACRSSEMVMRKVDFDRAMSMLNEVEKYMRHCFGEVGSARNIDCMVRIISTLRSRGRISYSELLQMHYRDVSSVEEFDKILGIYEASKTIRQTVNGKDRFIEFIRELLDNPEKKEGS